eukprot:3955444-Pyramimonas_sp.AAC.1
MIPNFLESSFPSSGRLGVLEASEDMLEEMTSFRSKKNSRTSPDLECSRAEATLQNSAWGRSSLGRGSPAHLERRPRVIP